LVSALTHSIFRVLEKFAFPVGAPVFPQVPALTPEQILAKRGLIPGPIQVFDPEAEATLVTWKPQR
jgi:hypothetical protein